MEKEGTREHYYYAYAWVYVSTEELGETIREIVLHISCRPKPEDYISEPDDIKTWEELKNRIEEIEEKGVSDEQIAKLVEEYFEENPIKTGATPEQVEQIEKNKQDIITLTKDKLDASKLPEAINTALAQAKESGQFDGKDGVDGKNGSDGKDGYTPVKGVDYFDGQNGKDGKNGIDGKTPIKGTDYFTQADKNELVTDVLNALPTWQGGSY